MCARTFGGADDGAEVMRVGQLVAEDDERRLPFFRGAGEDVVDGGIVVRGDDGDDALVRAGGGELIELAPVGLDDDGPGLLRRAAIFIFSEADVGIAISTGAAIAREIADITIASEDLFELVTLRHLSEALMARIHRNYRTIVGFNLGLIVFGVAGILPPTTSALLHNASTLAISLKSMTNLLPEAETAP